MRLKKRMKVLLSRMLDGRWKEKLVTVMENMRKIQNAGDCIGGSLHEHLPHLVMAVCIAVLGSYQGSRFRLCLKVNASRYGLSEGWQRKDCVREHKSRHQSGWVTVQRNKPGTQALRGTDQLTMGASNQDKNKKLLPKMHSDTARESSDVPQIREDEG